MTGVGEARTIGGHGREADRRLAVIGRAGMAGGRVQTAVKREAAMGAETAATVIAAVAVMVAVMAIVRAVAVAVMVIGRAVAVAVMVIGRAVAVAVMVLEVGVARR